MTDTSRTPESARLSLTGHAGTVKVTYPWTGKPWAAQADAANNGLQGQGYIVHAVMTVNRYAWLAWVVVGLMVVQIVLAVVQIRQALR